MYLRYLWVFKQFTNIFSWVRTSSFRQTK